MVCANVSLFVINSYHSIPVWIVSNEQLLAWVRNPVPASQLNSLKEFQCPTPQVSQKICNGIPENEAGLLAKCMFIEFPFYTCVSTCSIYRSSQTLADRWHSTVARRKYLLLLTPTHPRRVLMGSPFAPAFLPTAARPSGIPSAPSVSARIPPASLLTSLALSAPTVRTSLVVAPARQAAPPLQHHHMFLSMVPRLSGKAGSRLFCVRWVQWLLLRLRASESCLLNAAS